MTLDNRDQIIIERLVYSGFKKAQNTDNKYQFQDFEIKFKLDTTVSFFEADPSDPIRQENSPYVMEVLKKHKDPPPRFLLLFQLRSSISVSIIVELLKELGIPMN